MSKRVLIVDDEPNIVRALEASLSRAGFQVEVARDGDEAMVNLGRGAPPDLVLLDVRMPGLDGYEVCARARADPAFRATKIVMLTARDGPADRERALAVGADAYVAKPFRTGELVGRVRTMLDEGAASGR